MVTDVMGRQTMTNIVVTTSDLGLTIDAVVAGQSVVSGTIDDTNYGYVARQVFLFLF